MLNTTRVTITKVSGNTKTGPITTTRTERETCPKTCPFYSSGCYATLGRERMQWDRLNRNETGVNWDEFVSQIRRIVPNGVLWRHNTAGDLPHNEGNIDYLKLKQLINANKGRKGFTYSHHVLNEHNIISLQNANMMGFTVNASCESVDDADRVMSEHNIPAVAVVHSEESRRFFTTSSGRKVITCPAALHPGKVTCATCGLCQLADREFVIAFPAHGASKNKVNAIVTV
ncbi:MAG: DUF7227 family protein [Candidatus Planktophila sp.]